MTRERAGRLKPQTQIANSQRSFAPLLGNRAAMPISLILGNVTPAMTTYFGVHLTQPRETFGCGPSLPSLGYPPALQSRSPMHRGIHIDRGARADFTDVLRVPP